MPAENILKKDCTDPKQIHDITYWPMLFLGLNLSFEK